MPNLNDLNKPDKLTNHDLDVWDTFRAQITSALSWTGLTGAVNLVDGIKRLLKPSTGNVRIMERVSGAEVEIFNSENLLSKTQVTAQNIASPITGAIDSETAIFNRGVSAININWHTFTRSQHGFYEPLNGANTNGPSSGPSYGAFINYKGPGYELQQVYGWTITLAGYAPAIFYRCHYPALAPSSAIWHRTALHDEVVQFASIRATQQPCCLGALASGKVLGTIASPTPMPLGVDQTIVGFTTSNGSERRTKASAGRVLINFTYGIKGGTNPISTDGPYFFGILKNGVTANLSVLHRIPAASVGSSEIVKFSASFLIDLAAGDFIEIGGGVDFAGQVGQIFSFDATQIS